MDFSAPSPSGSSTGSSSGFDSSDTLGLNLILQEDMIQDSPMSGDWSQFSTMWQDFPDLSTMDFSNSPMVVDPSMLSKSIEPDLLTKPHFDYDFPFTFQNQSPSSLSSSENGSFTRRLSVSSGSGSISSSSEFSLDPAAELAQRVRESAGMITATQTGVYPSIYKYSTLSHTFQLVSCQRHRQHHRLLPLQPHQPHHLNLKGRWVRHSSRRPVYRPPHLLPAP